MEKNNTAQVPQKKDSFIKKLLKSYIFVGFLLAAVGVASLIWPEQSMNYLYVTIGVVLIVTGGVKVVSFFVDEKGEKKFSDLLSGAVLGAAGIALIVTLIVSDAAILKMTRYIVSALLIYGCLLMFVHAVRLRKQKGAMFIFSIIFAILTAACAAILLIYPEALWQYTVKLIGVSLIVEGLAMIIVLRKIKEQKQIVEQAKKEEKEKKEADKQAKKEEKKAAKKAEKEAEEEQEAAERENEKDEASEDGKGPQDDSNE